MSLGNALKQLRISRNLTQDQLAKNLLEKYPNTFAFNKGSISKWENDKGEPSLSTARILADYFGISIERLVQYKSNTDICDKTYHTMMKLEEPRQQNVYSFAEHQLKEQNESSTVYLVGQTAAGSPIAYGDTSYETISADVPKGADGALLVRGDSMSPTIEDNSIIFYKSQPVVENGEIAIIEIGGGEVTCKKFYFNGEKVILRSINDKYEDMIFDNGVRVIGKVIL